MNFKVTAEMYYGQPAHVAAVAGNRAGFFPPRQRSSIQHIARQAQKNTKAWGHMS